MITIFNTGEFDYSDMNDLDLKDKPVRYDINDLIEVASRTAKVNITQEHDGEVIGEMRNFIVEDGLLKAEEPNNLELSGMGFSPVFAFDLIEHKDYYEPTNIKMTEIGYTKTPRTKIVYNSIRTVQNSENNVMDDSEIQKLVKRNNELQEEIGVLKNNNKQLNKAIKDKDKEIKSIKESYADVDTKVKEYDHLKEIESEYNSLISSKKDDLIYQIVGDDKEKAQTLQNWSMEQLEFQKQLMGDNSDTKGITPQQAQEEGGLDDGNDPTPDDDGKDMSDDEMIKFYEDNFGEKPSFLND